MLSAIRRPRRTMGIDCCGTLTVRRSGPSRSTTLKSFCRCLTLIPSSIGAVSPPMVTENLPRTIAPVARGNERARLDLLLEPGQLLLLDLPHLSPVHLER